MAAAKKWKANKRLGAAHPLMLNPIRHLPSGLPTRLTNCDDIMKAIKDGRLDKIKDEHARYVKETGGKIGHYEAKAKSSGTHNRTTPQHPSTSTGQGSRLNNACSPRTSEAGASLSRIDRRKSLKHLGLEQQ